MQLDGRIIKNGMWVVWDGKRGILHAPYIEVRDKNTGALIDHDHSRVDFCVVADDRTTLARLQPAADDFFATARLAKFSEIPAHGRISKAACARLGYL